MAGVSVPDGLTLIDDNKSSVSPEMPGGIDIPEGLTLIESRTDKLSREMEHKPPLAPGITNEQLEIIKDKAPAAIGGIVGGVLTGGAGFVPAAAGALLGGVFGESQKDLYNYFYAPEKAPKGGDYPTSFDKNSPEAKLEAQIQSVLSAGGEEVVNELGGRVVANVIGKGYHIISPKIKGGVAELQKQFEKYQGSFTLRQRTDAWLPQQLESLAEGSLTGKGIFKAAEDINDAALNRWQDDLSNQIAKNAKVNMTDAEFGAMVNETFSGGDAAFRAYTKEMYGAFDDLVKTNIKQSYVTKQVPSAIVDERGKQFVYEQTEKIIEEFRPVDVRPLKEAAMDLNKRLQKINYLGKKDFGGETIDKIIGFDDALKFSDAQNAHSTLAAIKRMASDAGDTKLAGAASYLDGKLMKQMDAAAKNQGEGVYRKYLSIKREAEQGYRAFNGKFTYNILKDDANLEKIAGNMFKDGSSDSINKFKVTLAQAAKYDDRIDPAKIMDQVKQQYMEYILTKSAKPVALEVGEGLSDLQARSGVPNSNRLAQFFTDKRKRTTMDALLTEGEKQNLLDFGNALALTQSPNQAGAGMLMQLTQGGVIIQAATNPNTGTLRKAASILLPSKYVAYAMTKPSLVKLFTSAAETSVYKKQAAIVSSKIYINYLNWKREQEGKQTVAKDVTDYVEGAGGSVFDYGKRLFSETAQ